MSIHTDDDPQRRARALFDAQVEALDGPTATALRARRREALAGAHRRRARWWWPASGVATAALALALWLPRSEGIGEEAEPLGAGERVAVAPAPLPDAATATDTDPTTAARFADGALTELDEDADFYAWLATVPADDTDTTALPPQGSQEGWTL